jgi:hypothetical protein
MPAKKFFICILLLIVPLISTHSVAMEIEKTRTVNIWIKEDNNGHWSEGLSIQLRESKLRSLNIRQYVVKKALKEAAKIGPVPLYSFPLLTTGETIMQSFLVCDNPPNRTPTLNVVLTTVKRRD